MTGPPCHGRPWFLSLPQPGKPHDRLGGSRIAA